jgi:peptidoglycan/xylan/chitin deacetylase (PgdA/CDA1 family)
VGAAVAASASHKQVLADQTKKASTMYVAAYDVESGDCLRACQKIVAVHKRMEMPATFFIVGQVLKAKPKEFRRLLDDELFEVASHTYTHHMYADHEWCGPGMPIEEALADVLKTKEYIEELFERPVAGIRPVCGFSNGLKSHPEVIGAIKEAGHAYISSQLWGPDLSMPALLAEPFSYSEQGFPDMWELPGHGWHENLLKDNNRWGPKRLTLWPPLMPEAVPAGFVKTAKDEFDVNKVFLERAKKRRSTFVSLIWHPWSLYGFDSAMEMLELTFKHVRKLGLNPTTYGDLYRKVSAQKG